MKLETDTNFLLSIAKIRWAVSVAWQQFSRRYGLFGIVIVLCFLAIIFLITIKVHGDNKVAVLLKRQATIDEKVLNIKVEQSKSVDGHAQIKAFHQVLLPYNRVPDAIQDMLQLAIKQNLKNARGEYKTQMDAEGGFLRYQMMIPVTGDIQSIHRYIQNALSAQKTLALESIKFKRERTDTDQIEASIQWVLFAQLPADGVPDNSKFE